MANHGKLENRCPNGTRLLGESTRGTAEGWLSGDLPRLGVAALAEGLAHRPILGRYGTTWTDIRSPKADVGVPQNGGDPLSVGLSCFEGKPKNTCHFRGPSF